MSALKQYLDLFREHRGLIDANSAAPVNALRDEAAHALEKMRLPRRGDENFENIDMEEMLSPDYGLNLQKVDIDVNLDMTFRCEIPVSPQSVLMKPLPKRSTRYPTALTWAVCASSPSCIRRRYRNITAGSPTCQIRLWLLTRCWLRMDCTCVCAGA